VGWKLRVESCQNSGALVPPLFSFAYNKYVGNRSQFKHQEIMYRPLQLLYGQGQVLANLRLLLNFKNLKHEHIQVQKRLLGIVMARSSPGKADKDRRAGKSSGERMAYVDLTPGPSSVDIGPGA
jgi:hypothetical protein